MRSYQTRYTMRSSVPSGLPNRYPQSLSILLLPLYLRMPLVPCPSPSSLYLPPPTFGSPSPSSLYLRTPAVAQSSAKLSGSGGEKLIFTPHRPHHIKLTKGQPILTISRQQRASPSTRLDVTARLYVTCPPPCNGHSV